MSQISAPKSLRQTIALALVVALCALPAQAGLIINNTQGVVLTGADGIFYHDLSGVVLTGADGLLSFEVNGIKSETTSGVVLTGADGVVLTGADGATYTGTNTYAASRADGVVLTGADGVVLTGADGVVLTGADGATWEANSVVVRQADGVVLTGADGVVLTGADGVVLTGADGVVLTGADGMRTGRTDRVRIDAANQIVGTKADGTVFSAPTNGVVLTGADGVVLTGADRTELTGAQEFRLLGYDGVSSAAGSAAPGVGLAGFDPELAIALDRLTDDSNVSAAVVYHRAVTDADIADLKALGVRGGTRFQTLPAVVVTASKRQLEQVSKLRSVRYISGNRTLQWNNDSSRTQTGLLRMRKDTDIQRVRGTGSFQGNGVTVAVLDTGIDGGHPDISNRVFRNVKLADLQGVNLLDFVAPANVEKLSNTDQASGHGTFVGGIIAGSGASSGGKYAGYAPKSKLVGLSAGDASLFNVLAGFDYLLSRPDMGVRVVNCSFSANTLYDENDPVNVATRMLYDRGVNVVFSAGNTGPGMSTLNPYAAAPWVISVAALDQRGRLADYSSRGVFGSRNFRPTLAAPGTSVISLRASGTNLTGTTGLPADAQALTAAELPHYTNASGTSFSAPQVAGTIALMLEADPTLTPARVREILQRTATPLPAYYQHEVGAGALNTHAAVLQAAFPQREIGLFRAVIDRGQVSFVKQPAQEFSGTVYPGKPTGVTLDVPADAVYASTSVAWGPIITTNDLALTSFDPAGGKAGESNYLNLPGLTGKRERTLFTGPAAGRWRAEVRHTLSAAATPQEFRGLFETARIEYAPLADTAGLDAQTLSSIRTTLRTFTMWPEGRLFRPSGRVSRADLAAAVVAGGLVPQYMPASPSFLDVTDETTMNFVESAHPLFPDAVRGSNFRPDRQVTRLVAAVVLVRAAGLRAEAESNSSPLLFTDGQAIPAELQGYASVAVRRGLLTAAGQFNPNGTMTRAELARALDALFRLRAAS